MSPLGWALIQSAWCSYTTKRRQDDGAQKRDQLRTQGEGGHLQARREASGETGPALTLILDLQPPDLWDINICGASHPVCGICHGGPC